LILWVICVSRCRWLCFIGVFGIVMLILFFVVVLKMSCCSVVICFLMVVLSFVCMSFSSMLFLWLCMLCSVCASLDLWLRKRMCVLLSFVLLSVVLIVVVVFCLYVF